MQGLDEMARQGVIAHWELDTESRKLDGHAVELDVFRVILPAATDDDIMARLRPLQSKASPHLPIYVKGEKPYISLPLG